MPAQTFLILLVSVIAVAGLTIVLVWSFGLSFLWLGLAALLLTLALRKLKW